MAEDPTREGADNPERPEWLPEQFETPEALAASYGEAQRKITELGQQNKSMEESFSQLSNQFDEFVAQQQQQQSQPQPQYDYNADPYVAAITQARLEGDEMRALQLQDARTAAIIGQALQLQQQQIAQQQQPVQPNHDVIGFMANQTMRQAYEDWGEHVGDVQQLIQNDPVFANNDALWSNAESATRALDAAYRMVKSEKVLSGAISPVNTTAMKLAAQSASGATGRLEPSGPDRWEEISGAKSGKLDL